MNEEKICYLCGHSDFEKLEGNVRDNSSLDVLRCKNCSLVFLSSFEHICNSFYEDAGMHGGNLDLKKWLECTKDDDARRFKFLKKQIKGKKILDFGSGNGGFLIKAKKIAKKAVGIELEKSINDFYQKNGLEVFQDISRVCEKFDYITLFHVLEHLKDPVEMLKKLGEKLEENRQNGEKGGEIIIEVPNSNDALISIYQNRAFMDFTYWSCHLFLFNEATLTEIVEKAGFKINYLKHVQRYGFANHLWWQFMKKPGGHKKLWFINCKILNKFYEKSLASIKATDTIVVSISK